MVQRESPHILLISLDTVRRDYLSCYGYQKQISPHMDRLAENGVRFTGHIANCGWTLPQNLSLFTGLYPLTHGRIRLKDSPPLNDKWPTITEHLKSAGYMTFGCVTTNAYGGGSKYGFNRGFDDYLEGLDNNQHMDESADFAINHFCENHSKGPCFVYLHVNATHQPFQAPEPWNSMWGESLQNKYEAEISYVDYYIGKIISELESMKIRQNTLIVIFSDHGAEFWEHGFWEKKVNLYGEIIEVPLILSCPSHLPQGRVVDGLVETVDVAPTILDIAGAKALPNAQGHSLLSCIQGKSANTSEYVCSHTAHNYQGKSPRSSGPLQYEHFAIQNKQWKLIRTHLYAEPDELAGDWKERFQALMLRTGQNPSALAPGKVVRELYNLKADPGENHTLLSQKEEVAQDLESKLDKWIAYTKAEAVD